jgi:hypothetical protein
LTGAVGDAERFGRSYKADNYCETMSDMVIRATYNLLANALQKHLPADRAPRHRSSDAIDAMIGALAPPSACKRFRSKVHRDAH